MMTFIFSISFILHIITIFAIYLLFKQIQQLKSENVNDTIPLLEGYLQEVKEENNRLQAALNIDSPDDDRHEGMDETKQHLTNETLVNDDLFSLPEAETDTADHIETSFQAKVLQLYDQGFSETEIAQKLNCGKTEAALIIKLHLK